MSNDMTNSEGRLCNHIIRAHAASFISKNNNLEFNYGQYFDKMKALGINLFTTGTMKFNMNIVVTDYNLLRYLDIASFRNINVNNSFFQTKEFSHYLYTYYKDTINQTSIINANKFKERYKNNNDVFIHIRLGDVAKWNQGFDYYDKALSQILFENGYIASDDLNHDICQKLIKKYNLNSILYDEVETIMFGSTCKNIVLSGGTFSYIIGLFGFFSKIYYLKPVYNWFPPELYHIDEWTKISI